MAKTKLNRRSDGLYEKSLTINGKRKTFYAKTQSELWQKVAAYQHKEEQGAMFQEVADAWLEDYYNEHYTSLSGALAAYHRLSDRFKDIPIKDITTRDITVFLHGLKHLSRKTVLNHKSVCSCIMNRALIEGHIQFNPAQGATIPKNLTQNRRELPTPDQIDIIKQNFDKPFGLYAFFLLYTGCRRGEALALQYKDLDYTKKEIRINKSAYFVANKMKTKTPKSKAGFRTIPFLDKLIEVLPEKPPDYYIFGGDTPLLASQERKGWDKFKKEVGLTITPHQLRHAYATILYEAGVDERMAMEILGHANISTTKEIYTHISLSKITATKDILNRFVVENT